MIRVLSSQANMLTTSLAWLVRHSAPEANKDLIQLTASEQLIGADCRGKSLIPDDPDDMLFR